MHRQGSTGRRDLQTGRLVRNLELKLLWLALNLLGILLNLRGRWLGTEGIRVGWWDLSLFFSLHSHSH